MIPRATAGLAIGLGLLVTACGSQAHADRNNAQLDAQLNAASAAMPEDAGRGTSKLEVGPTAKGIGDQMRSAAAHPPPPH